MHRFIVGITLITLLFTVGVYSAKATADINLVLPAYLHHVQHYDEREYNEGWFNNQSFGLEMTTENYSVALLYVNKNSDRKKSVYSYVLRRLYKQSDFSISFGLMAAAGGYMYPVIASPVIEARYKWLQVATTAPVAKALGAQADLITVQLIIPTGF